MDAYNLEIAGQTNWLGNPLTETIFLPSLIKDGEKLPRNGLARTYFPSCDYDFVYNPGDASTSDTCVPITPTNKIPGCIFHAIEPISSSIYCEVCDSSGLFVTDRTLKDGTVAQYKTLYMDIPNRYGDPSYTTPLPCIVFGYIQPGPDLAKPDPENWVVYNKNFTLGEEECINNKDFGQYGYTDPKMKMIRYDYKTCKVCDMRSITGASTDD